MSIDIARAREMLGEEVKVTFFSGRAIQGKLKAVESLPILIVEAPDGARHRASGITVDSLERADAA